jgi:serine/threonine-protein kinase HipA
MRQAQVFYKNTFAGIIRESDEGFVFQYDREYLASALPKPVSLTYSLFSMA